MIIGVDIGGTKTAVAGFARDDVGLRRITPVHTIPTPAREGGEAIVHAVSDVVRAVCGATPLEALGIGTAGVVGPAGAITSATDAIHGWIGFPVRDAFMHALGVPVSVANDVHAAAVAESAVGAGADADSVLLVAVGTGIGGAVVLHGALRRGATGTAGSIGHTEIALPARLAARRCPCGASGHVEAVASGPALEQTYAEESGVRLSLREVDAAARAGDAIAHRVITEGAQYLGRALASVNAVLDVEAIVVGGGVAEIGESYLAEVVSAYRAAAMPGPAQARIVPAGLGIDAGLTGAAMLAAG